MKKILVALLLAVIALLSACDKKGGDNGNGEKGKSAKISSTETKKAFRAIGMTIARNLAVFGAYPGFFGLSAS